MGETCIFVSHSHKDEDFTQRLVDDLHQAGAEVWVDVLGITHGNFMQPIEEALAQCDWLVLVLTPNAIASQYVRDEVGAALHRVQQGNMQAVIPVLGAACPGGSIPSQWEALHRLNATQNYAAALSGLLREVGLPPTAPSEHFSERLAQLHFERRVINGIEVIIPPVCDVPAGEFQMGSNPERDEVAWADEQPQHRVFLTSFQIGRFPITVAEYACAVRVNAVQEPPASHGITTWETQLAHVDQPVACVSWRAAVTYLQWLTSITGQAWQLPTEAQWEKAARGTDGRTYPWGDSFDSTCCNTIESGIGTRTSVGSYPTGASPYGVQDVAGNVWEWTDSWFLPYPYRIPGEREEVYVGTKRVLRGGSWFNHGGQARAAYRDHYLPVDYYGYFGFRAARMPASP